MAEVGKDIAKAKALIERGLTVAVPTETVYGLAANALDPKAVVQIFDIKQRPTFDPLIVHGASRDRLSAYVTNFPGWAAALAERFWPGPLTLVLPRATAIPDLVTSGLDTVAIRVPDHPLLLELLFQLEVPLAAPSANPFGYISPTTPRHVLEQLGGAVPYILDGGPCRIGIESTIITEIGGSVVVLRPGGLDIEDIEDCIGPVALRGQPLPEQKGDAPRLLAPRLLAPRLLAPGLLESHYAPRTPLILGPLHRDTPFPPRTGILCFQTPLPGIPPEHQRVLSSTGDLREAASRLFAALRELDSLHLDLLLAGPLPETGLGRAINDRLRRAAA